MWFAAKNKTLMPTAEQALPGRQEAMPVPERHHVNGNRIVPPFPDGMELALGGGEDYALLLTVPKRKLPALRKKLRLVEVGRIVRGRGIQLTELGSPRPLPRRSGFDHLRK